jgi:hypothetical protein
MPYKLTLTFEGKERQLGVADTCDFQLLPKKFQLINAIYPIDQGYDITVNRIGSKYPPFNRRDFKRLLERCAGEDLLVFFFHNDEYETFVGNKRLIDPRDLDGRNYCYHLDCYKNVNQVIKYPRHFHILELMGAPEKYLLPYMTSPKSNCLEDLELHLYRCYLADY